MPLHVSSTMCSSSGGSKLFYTASGRWPSGAQVESARGGHIQHVTIPDAV